MDVLARWTEVLEGPEDDLPLDEAALLISACAHPGMDVAAQLARIDDLARAVETPTTDGICQALFGELGFAGDREDYGDPSNSYLDRVIDRRRGIPITLSLLLIEIARRHGIRLDGVGMPGHFLVREPDAPETLIDCFDSGRRIDMAGCRRLLAATTGAPALTPEMLSSTGKQAILARMLANLDRSFAERHDGASMVWLCELRLRLPSAPLGDRVQLGARLADLGRLDVAAGVLEDVSGDAPDEETRSQLAHEAIRLRARLN